MIKFSFYKLAFPFRSRLQNRLRRERDAYRFEDFKKQLGEGVISPIVAAHLWELLRQCAFVDDFRPSPDDDLDEVFAMGPEEVKDELIEPLIGHLGGQASSIDVKDVDLANLRTPRQVAAFIARHATPLKSSG